jgi:ribose 5-phosphate isomerase
LLATKSLLKD